jgi:hypothetical protein
MYTNVQKMEKQLPVYRLFIDLDSDEGGELIRNSVVSYPAHEKTMIAFNEAVKYDFNDEKQNIVGVAIVPDKLIYRSAFGDMPEHYVKFQREDIEKLVYKYGKQLKWNDLTSEHEETQNVEAIMYMSYIVDRSKGLNPPTAFEKEPDGTWILGYHIPNKEQYKYLKKNKTGFSVEGNFLMQLIKNQNSMKKEESKFSAFLKGIERLVKSQKFASAKLADGTEITYEGELAEGTIVMVVDAEGNEVKAPDGEHTLEDGRVIVVADGVVTSVVEASSEEASEELSEEVSEAFSKMLTLFEAQDKRIKDLESTVENLSKKPAEKQEKKKFTADVNDKLQAAIERTKAYNAKK